MTETEWEGLRGTLAKQFGEDVAQAALLALLEQEAKGVEVLNPLPWCRVTAGHLTRSAVRGNRLDLSKETHEQLEAASLLALRCSAPQLDRLVAREELRGYEFRGLEAPLSPSPEAVRKRRQRRRERAA